jgi:hypothetical protein
MRTHRNRIAAVALGAILGFAPLLRAANAEEKVERAGTGVGLTVGNALFVPIKAISVSMGVLGSALAFVFMGGNGEVTQQSWRNTLQDPYVITPEVARKAIGERPELIEK